MGRALIALLVLLLSAGALAAEVKVTRTARLYDGPSSLHKRIRSLDVGEILTVRDVADSGAYRAVRTSAGEEGWVYGPYVVAHTTATPAPTPPTATPALDSIDKDEMRLHFIDVGQGNATLIETPCGAALIDTGGESSSKFDGDKLLTDYLQDFFARRSDLKDTLDLLVLTHAHEDHTHGIDELIASDSAIAIANVVDNGHEKGDQVTLHEWLSTAAGESIGHEDVGAAGVPQGGLTSAVIDPLKGCPASQLDPVVRVLWGGGGSDENNASVVVRVEWGAFSALFTGDLETSAINKVLTNVQPALLDVDLYEVGHHGAENATTEALVQAMTPKLAVVSMGKYEREGQRTARSYGHPRKAAVDRLSSRLSCSRDGKSRKLALTGDNNKTKAKSTWVDQSVSKAIYGTGWDGTVVVGARSDGTIELQSTESGATFKCP